MDNNNRQKPTLNSGILRPKSNSQMSISPLQVKSKNILNSAKRTLEKQNSSSQSKKEPLSRAEKQPARSSNFSRS